MHTVFWNWMFAFGGVVPTGICAVFTATALADRGWRRGAALWSLSLVLVIALGTISKMVHYRWGIEYGLGTFRGASGHVLRAAAVYPSFALAIFAGSPRRRLLCGFVIGCLLAALVAVAAVSPGVHTAVEALAGAALGSLAGLVLWEKKGLPPLRGYTQLAVVVSAFVLWMVLPPFRYDLEQRVVDFSLRPQQSTLPGQ